MNPEIQNHLIPITKTDDGQLLVKGRELHKLLQIRKSYPNWFKKITDGLFVQGEDFYPIDTKTSTFSTVEDHLLTLELASHIALLQKSNIGKAVRHYLIAMEKQGQLLAKASSKQHPLEAELTEIRETQESMLQLLNELVLNNHINHDESLELRELLRCQAINDLEGTSSRAYHNLSVRGKVYMNYYNTLTRNFGLKNLNHLRRYNHSKAKQFILNHQIPMELQIEIMKTNNPEARYELR